MRLNIDCREILRHRQHSPIVVEVDQNMKIEDVIALLTVQESHISYDKVQLLYNRKILDRHRKLSDYLIKDDYTIQAKELEGGGCCYIF
jgi:hypothetical protein